jgi:hypothetical protein
MLFMLLIICTRVVDARRQAEVLPPSDGDGGGVTEEEYQQLRQAIDRLASDLNSRREELVQLTRRRDQLQQLLALKQDEADFTDKGGLLQGVDLVDHPVCRLIPSQDVPVAKKPLFIEVDADGYLVQPAGRRFAVRELPRLDADIDGDHPVVTPMEDFLEEAYRKRNREYLIFLVRPNGATTFRVVWRYLLLKYPHGETPGILSGIETGWEPFREEWSLLTQSGDNS